MRRIGVLTAFAENDAEAQANITAFRQSFEKVGWIEGRNLAIDYRWGDADPERIRNYAISAALDIRPLHKPHPLLFFGGASPGALAMGARWCDVYAIYARVAHHSSGIFARTVAAFIHLAIRRPKNDRAGHL